MKLIKLGAIIITSIIVFLIGIAYLLPNEYGVTRSIMIKASPEKIFPYLVTPKEWTKWSVWNQRDPNMLMTYNGIPSGQGASWTWQSKSQGNGSMTFTQIAENVSIKYELQFEGMGKASIGTLMLENKGEMTELTWTMTGNSQGNFMMKLFAPFMNQMVGPDFDAGLTNLKTLLEKSN